MTKYRPAVMAIIVNEKNEFLIGYNPKYKGFSFPQGGKEGNETSFENLKRELNEELDIIIFPEDILLNPIEKIKYNYREAGLKRFNGKYIGQEQEIFIIKYNDKMEFNPKENDDGILEFNKDSLTWISFEEFDNYDFQNKQEAYKKALQLCGIN